MATMKTLNGYGFNATELNGKTSDNYLLITDTASDSAKLGGKSASDYALKTDTAPDSSKLGGKTLAEIMLALYPVGAVYISANSTSPASLFGGTWERLKDRFLLGAGDSYAAGGTGGEAEHTLISNEIPAHYHDSYLLGFSGTVDAPAYYAVFNKSAYTYNYEATTPNTLEVATTTRTGGNQPHNNMPPYLAVYMWKRVS